MSGRQPWFSFKSGVMIWLVWKIWFLPILMGDQIT